jgi:hypothetical protein
LTAAAAVLALCFILGTLQYGVLHQQARMRVVNPENYQTSVRLVIVLFGLGFGLVSAVALTAWWVCVSHRVAGPLLVLERYFRELGSGRFPRVRSLRRKDEFKYLHETFAGTVESLKAFDRAQLTQLNHSAHMLESLAETAPANMTADLAMIESSLDSLRTELINRLGPEAEREAAKHEGSTSTVDATEGGQGQGCWSRDLQPIGGPAE